VAALLLKHGARVNAQNIDGFTAFHLANLESTARTAELLRQNGGHE